jgi:hypothetical protein
MEEGKLVSAQAGTPQGAVISPRTHLVNSSFQSDCPWCDRIGIARS